MILSGKRGGLLKRIILKINAKDIVKLETKAFTNSLEDLEEMFHIMASGTKMLAAKVEELKNIKL